MMMNQQSHAFFLKIASVCFVVIFAHSLVAEPATPLPNVHDLASDLIVPSLSNGKPMAGKRVLEALEGYEDWELRHVVYLPTDWHPNGNFPVLVEYPGNGGYQKENGDVSTGRVEDCKLGYGISAGHGFIWISLPFVDPKTRQHSLTWWGDPDVTTEYCRKAVSHVCRNFNGDANAVILCGFSRGAIACSYIGLRDDEIAKLWRAMILHSHYDGVRDWRYAGADADSARIRWSRFQGKPQFVVQEKSVDNIRVFLANIDSSKVELIALPFQNHTDVWVLKDLPERKKLREWLTGVLRNESNDSSKY